MRHVENIMVLILVLYYLIIIIMYLTIITKEDLNMLGVWNGEETAIGREKWRQVVVAAMGLKCLQKAKEEEEEYVFNNYLYKNMNNEYNIIL